MAEHKLTWTIETYAAHNEALRMAEEKFMSERDRRYGEVKAAEEKALKIKEESDKIALGLQRENQLYKDEKANQLREQIGSERGLYATKLEVIAAVEKIVAVQAPLLNYVANQQGGSKGMKELWGWIVAALLAGATLFNVFGPHFSK